MEREYSLIVTVDVAIRAWGETPEEARTDAEKKVLEAARRGNVGRDSELSIRDFRVSEPIPVG